MPLKLSPDVLSHSEDAPPLTTQLADHIRQAIQSLDLEPGAVVPGEKVIAAAVGVSRPVAREALKMLEIEGLIIRSRGAATRVAIAPSVRRVNLSRYLRTIEDLESGRTPVTYFLDGHGATADDYTIDPCEIIQTTATAQDAEYLHTRKGTAILRRRLVQNLGGTPYQLYRDAMRYSDVKGTAMAHGVSQDPGGILAELHGIGVVPTNFAEIWGARPPNKEERERLHIRVPGSAVLYCLRVFATSDDPRVSMASGTGFRPVHVSRLIMPAAQNELYVEGSLRLA